MISLTPNGEQSYSVILENGVLLGEICKVEDGYYVFFPELRGGFWESVVMREIANTLDDLNRAWDEEVKADLERLERNRESTNSG